MAACASDWSSRSEAPTYSLWRRSHDLRMSANASSPVGFCDGSALPAGTGVGAPAVTPLRSSEPTAVSPRSTKIPTAKANSATITSTGEPNRRPSRRGSAGETDASGATGTATPVTSTGVVNGSAAASGVVGGVTTGSTRSRLGGIGRREGHRRVTGAIEAGAAGARTSRTEDHRLIFAERACGRGCARDEGSSAPLSADSQPPHSRSDAGGGLGQVAAGGVATDLPDVLLVLEDDAQRLVDHVGREVPGAQ